VVKERAILDNAGGRGHYAIGVIGVDPDGAPK